MVPEPHSNSLLALEAVAKSAGVTFVIQGDASLLERRTRALLVSRNTAPPTPSAPWIRALCDEAERALQDGKILVTGSGRVAYELPQLLSAERAIPVVVFRQEGEAQSVTLPPGSLQIVLSGNCSDALRDELIGCVARAATRIAVRSGGNMAAIAERIQQRGGDVRDALVADSDSTPRERWPQKFLEPVFDPWPYLTHYTREADGAWPGETQADYLRWLRDAASPPRNSFATLCRILREQRIRSAGRFVRGGTAVTCWTELPPDCVATLRGWRKGLRRWNFTPYGIAIPRAAQGTFGARPVRYESESADALAQSPRSGSYDWTAEREWRVLGDVDLSRVAGHEMVVLTATEEEAELVKKEFGVAARATG